MLKIKEWEDQEYVVKSIEKGRMRMPDTGKEEEVLTRAFIEHKGRELYKLTCVTNSS